MCFLPQKPFLTDGTLRQQVRRKLPASSSRFLGTYSVPTLPWVRFGVRVRVGLGLVLIPKEGWADACPPSVPNDGDAMNFGINSQ